MASVRKSLFGAREEGDLVPKSTTTTIATTTIATTTTTIANQFFLSRPLFSGLTNVG